MNAAYSLTNLTYDGLDRLTSTTGGSGIGSSTINYDGLGNITKYISKGASLDYSYNLSLNRLTSVNDTIGSKDYNFANGYDTRGNVTSNGSRGFSYNLANQMTGSDGNNYVYDGYNRRVKTQDSKGTSYSMYSQSGRLLYRETELGGVNYIFLGDKLIAKEGVMPVSTDSRMHYKPFGDSIEAPKDEVGYTGHKFDTDLGWSYMQARYMDPVLGRFMSNDPVGFRDIHSFNRYVYANNNPYKYTDPTGQASEFSYLTRPMGVSVEDNLAVTSEAAGNAISAVDTASDFVAPLKGGLKAVAKAIIKKSCCFVAGTQVLTEDGYKNIEDIKLGEKLWAKNTDTGEQELKSVIKVFNEPDRGIYEINLKGIDGFEQKIE